MRGKGKGKGKENGSRSGETRIQKKGNLSFEKKTLKNTPQAYKRKTAKKNVRLKKGQSSAHLDQEQIGTKWGTGKRQTFNGTRPLTRRTFQGTGEKGKKKKTARRDDQRRGQKSRDTKERIRGEGRKSVGWKWCLFWA